MAGRIVYDMTTWIVVLAVTFVSMSVPMVEPAPAAAFACFAF